MKMIHVKKMSPGAGLERKQNRKMKGTGKRKEKGRKQRKWKK